tara:strand:- start:489 stop:887 length:399 start_codon:yes stop_codon:yes gene_type:complete
MNAEMNYLAMYGLFLAILIFLQVFISAQQHGLLSLLGNRENIVSTGMAERAERAVQNSIIAMALIAPAVLMIAYNDLSSSSTILATQIFLTARITYSVFFIFGIIYLRTFSWITGFLATAYLYLMLFEHSQI